MKDELAIRTIKQNYFHGVDSKNWALFASVFDEDCLFDFSAATNPPVPPIRGRGAIVAFVRSTMAEFTTVHHGFLRELEFSGAGSARALWAMEDILWRGEPGQLVRFLHGYGHYHEEYVKKDGIWLCSMTRLTRINVELF